MVELLFGVIILGIVAWGIMQLSIPEPFKTIAFCILLIILVVLLYRAYSASSFRLVFDYATNQTRIAQDVRCNTICSRSIT